VKSSRPVILACSGPSLNTVDVFEPGYPVAAISTAIRALKAKPAYWFLIDHIRRVHLPEGQAALLDPDVQTVTPEGRKREYQPEPPNTTWVRVNQNHYADAGREFLDGGPLLKAGNKSVLFAVQWLCLQGFDQFIFAGCDLEPGYAYRTVEIVRDRERQMEGLNQVYDTLKGWVPKARERGIEMLSWSPGRLNDLMESFAWKSVT
jgi:hypothetical protein